MLSIVCCSVLRLYVPVDMWMCMLMLVLVLVLMWMLMHDADVDDVMHVIRYLHQSDPEEVLGTTSPRRH